MAACVGRDSFVYERLLDRFSIELSKDRDDLDRQIRLRLSRVKRQEQLAKRLTVVGRSQQPFIRQKNHYEMTADIRLTEAANGIFFFG